ncbi:hypothetical protein V5O48_012887 [Marasmius crinis-equi]|uniref:Uncharacterized protein n=1 Tax=Marasmius crinis-equi TaxID=585013 RepID=A0ABR3F1X0_9AGAR
MHKECPWMLVQGSNPGVYSNGHEMDGETVLLAKEYTYRYQAEQDFEKLISSGLIDLMDTPKTGDADWAVVTEGYQVGIYEDRLTAFMLGLRWEVGSMALCASQERVICFFGEQLEAGRVCTKVKTVEKIPTMKAPRIREHWTVETMASLYARAQAVSPQ